MKYLGIWGSKILFTACFILLTLLTTTGLSAATPDSALRRFALFVGANDGGDDRVRLLYAGTDAESMQAVLSEMGGLERNDMLLLEDPDLSTFEQSFEDLRTRILTAKDNSRRIEFILYYSGHSDENGLMLGGELFPYKALRERINEMNADVNIAILDSCSSGSFTRLKGGRRRAPFMIDESVKTQGYAFLTSSSENEAAQESDAIQSSFFTHYLISALRGAADATQDGKITLMEAYTYASEETLARTENTQAGAQHPSYDIKLTGSGDLVLTDLRSPSAGMVIDKDIVGRLFIRNKAGRLMAEIRKLEGIPMIVALPPGMYTVTLEDEEMMSEAGITLTGTRMVRVSQSDFFEKVREFAVARGDVEEREDEVAEIAEEPDPVAGDAPAAGGAAKRAAEAAQRALSRLDEELKAAEDGAEMKAEAAASAGVSAAGDADATTGRQVGEKPARAEKPDASSPNRQARPSVSTDPVEGGISRRVLSFQFVPGLPFNNSRHIVTAFGLNFLGRSYRIEGAEIGFMNIVIEDVRGFQGGVLFNLVGGGVYGGQAASLFNIAHSSKAAQVAGLFNISNESTSVLQAAGVFNLASRGGMIGAQAAGIFNITGGTVRGVQTAGVFNINNGGTLGLQGAGVFNIADDTVGGQISGIFNIAGGGMTGIQGASVFNSARDAKGIQMSLVNISANVAGAQVGLINIAKNVKGTQIGLININRDMKGVPIGIINISKSGIFNFGSWYDERGLIYMGLQFGSKYLFTTVYAGMPYEDPLQTIAAGVGGGVHVPIGPFFAELEASVQEVAQGTIFKETFVHVFTPQMNKAVYPVAKVTGGITLFGSLSIFGGLVMDIHVPGYTVKSGLDYPRDPWVLNFPSRDVELHPRWFAGLRF